MKLAESLYDREQLLVTPHVGVWIETRFKGLPSISTIVTPHVGVWIEMLSDELDCAVIRRENGTMF